MCQEDYSKYLETLELSTGASLSEIRRAYLHLKALYSRESIVTLPIEDEISKERKREILRQIEEAYHSLLNLFEKENIVPGYEKGPRFATKDIKQAPTNITTFSGKVLQEIRERLSIELQDIALSTRVQTQYLKSIELEVFDALPPEAYTRGFVISYAEYLSLDSKKVADDYMNRYHAWKDEHKNKT
jgi:hypothetical protein